MVKKGAGKLFILLLAGFVLLSTAVSAQNLNCQVRNTNCLPSETQFFRMSGNTNAHAETLEGTGSYAWKVCCKSTVGGASLTETCPGDSTLTALSSVSNAHAEIPGTTDYPEQVCMDAGTDTILCRTINDACAVSEKCVFTQSSQTNAHVAACAGNPDGSDPYSWNTCCKFFQSACGAEGQACCGGSLCFNPLQCISGTCQNVPIISGCSGVTSSTAKLLGTVTNISSNCGVTGDQPCPVAGAVVNVLGKGSTTTAADGSYSITLSNANDNTPYDIIVSQADYDTSSVYGYEIFDNQCFSKDFTLLKPAGGCNSDCTKVDGLCHAECQGRGLCSYYSEGTRQACNNAVPGIISSGSENVVCCAGGPYSPVKANVNLLCGENLLSAKIPVLFKGKLVNMVLAVFDSVGCK